MKQCLHSVNWDGKISMHENKHYAENVRNRVYTPEWYSGSCLTVVTWILSGSRQLHKEPELFNREWDAMIS
jgi:hypothetical protein